jgi:DNA invertase Pin-like site-specific DNA recombinase
LEVDQGSNERQKAEIIKWVQRKDEDDGIQSDIKWFEDKALTGKNTNRKHFQEMMHLLEEGIIIPAFVVVTKVDRFARSNSDLELNVNRIHESGAEFISTAHHIDTANPVGKAFLQLLGVFAELEVALINERTAAGRESARERGVQFGRPPLKVKTDSGFVNISKDKVVDLYMNKGLSMNNIAKSLGCSITPIKRVLKNYPRQPQSVGRLKNLQGTVH